MPAIEVQKTTSLAGHREGVYSLETSHLPGQFFSAGADGLVAQWDLARPQEGQLLARVPKSVYALCHLPEQCQLAVGQNFEGLHLIDLPSRQAVRSAHVTEAAIFALAHWGGKLYAGTGNGTLTVLHAADLSTFGHHRWSGQALRALAVHPTRPELAAGYSDWHIRIIDLVTLRVRHTVAAHANSVFSLAYSPDGRWLLSGSRDAHLKIWDTERGYAPHQSIVAHMYTINHIAYSPSGRYFATCSKDKSVKLWDAAEFRLLKVIDRARHAGHGTSVNRLLWANEQTLLSASDDRSISVWQIDWPNHP
ncbi:MAG: PQQ-binding-like beta-propeller repeat protein [Bernardetiaceae bacterium]|jgi:WD40 repeat protein|nr:PQQ-binding-like beta-propeller repeat protein [Bernardetiaceae bacterium]